MADEVDIRPGSVPEAPMARLQHLSRETFLAELLEGLVAVLESALGPDISSSCIHSIGLSVGARLDRDYKAALQLTRPLTADEYGALVDELVKNLHPGGRVVSAQSTRVELEMPVVPETTSSSENDPAEIISSVAGAIGALNFGYARVCRNLTDVSAPAGSRRIAIFLEDTPETRARGGEEFYPEIVNAFEDVRTQLRVVEENRLIREQLQESAAEFRDRNRQITAAARIASTVSQSLDPLEIVTAGLRMLMDAIGVEVGAVFRVNEETDQLELSYGEGLSAEATWEILHRLSLPSEPQGKAPWHAFLSARCHSPAMWEANGFQAYATAPIVSKERPIGALLVLARMRQSFAPLDMELLELVANEIGVGLENIRLYDYLAQQVRRLTALREIGTQLNQCNELDRVLDLAAESVTRRLDFDRVGIFLINEGENCLEQVRGTDEHGRLVKVGRTRVSLDPSTGTLARAVHERRPLHVLDIASEADLVIGAPEAAGLADLRISAFARVPLIAEDRVVGAVSVDNMLRRRPISHDDLNMLMILGNQVAIAIDNARFTEALQRSAEKLRRVDAVRSEFVSMISHEFRSPLHKIRNAASVLREDEVDPLKNRFTRTIIRSTDYLTFLVNNLLAQSRMEQAALIVDPRAIDLADFVGETVRELRSAAIPSEQQVTVSVPADLVVNGDPSYLKLILTNLTTNASKASAREGRIDIYACPAGGYAQICVRDYGIGIPQDRQADIFERFVTLKDRNADRLGGGVGLGLYICRSLVNAHGGRIWVNSEPGQGSEFCFTMPLAWGSGGPADV